MPTRANASVRSVERALDILQMLAISPGGTGLTAIASRASLPKSTAHRLLSTLEARGFVKRDPTTDQYCLGLRTLELATCYFEGDDLTTVALPEMRRLRDQFDETVSLYVRDGQERVRVQKVESRQAVRRVVQIGQRMPLYIGASGKVILAHCDTQILEQVLGSLPEIFDKENLLRQLEDVRRRGYATSIEEREQGTSAVAAPIFNRSGIVTAALCISGPTSRFGQDNIAKYGESVALGAKNLNSSW